MDRATARLWRHAHTMADYGELTAQWLEGRIPSQPGYMPGCGPDDETLPHVDVLAAINRAGYVTDCSQPGIDTIGYDGARWCQRAAVTGFMETGPKVEILGRLVAAAGLVMVILRPLPRGRASHAVVVTQRNGEGFTWFGGPRGRDELMPYHGGSRRLVDAMWRRCLEVVVFDPAWGRNDRLWPVLADFAANAR